MMVSQVLAVGPWLRSLTFVSLTSLVCKMGIRWSPYKVMLKSVNSLIQSTSLGLVSG